MYTQNLLFSGGKLKGTGCILGFVVYCGVESRLQLNADPYRKKYSRLEKTINIWVLYILVILTLLVLGSVLGFYYFNNYSTNDYEILEPIITFTLLYNNIIPISLFMAIDIIRVLKNKVFSHESEGISFNTDIINENLGQIDYLVTDKTGTLTEKKLTTMVCMIDDKIYELENDADDRIVRDTDGLLILSPRKSGVTSSFNDLKLHFQLETPNNISKNFIYCMALCNNLHQYSNEFLGSQEEISMVEAAKTFGYHLNIRESRIYELSFNDTIHSYKAICSRQLTKEGKRSRILFEDLNDGGGIIYVKGSPEVMKPLLNISATQKEIVKIALENFQNKGNSCYILAYKKFSQTQIIEYKAKVEKIKRSLVNKEGRLEAFFRSLEKEIKYLGIVGITEKLHPEANEILYKIQQAGIRIILVSSDSTDSSFRTGKEAGIINPEGVILELLNLRTEAHCAKALKKSIERLILDRRNRTGFLRPSISNLGVRGRNRVIPRSFSQLEDQDQDPESVGLEQINEDIEESPRLYPQSTNNLIRKFTRVDAKVKETTDQPFDPYNIDYSVIIDRVSFKMSLHDQDCRKMLVCVLACAKSAVFTELMPRDKGNVVKLLKENVRFSPLIAAIGCGEGDISMLEQADIGIGIKNQEESLAMNYSDVTINSFHQLTELILVHGHYNYMRLSKVILLFLYKNCVLTIVLLAYTFVSSYSGTSIFNSSLLIGYNIFFTTIPIVVIGIFDEDVSSSKIIEQPQLYMIGIKNVMFNTKKLFVYFCISAVQGIILIILCFQCLPMVLTREGFPEDMILFGTFTYITLIVMVLQQIYIETYCYSYKYYLSIVISIISLIISLAIESNSSFPDADLYGVGQMLTKSGFSMLSLCFTSTACIIPVYFIYTYINVFHPQMIDMLKSNHSLMSFKVCKYEQYQDCLSKIYKHTTGWKNKTEDEKFSINKFSLRFDKAYIEKKYIANFIRDNLFMFKLSIGVLLGLLILWTIFGGTFLSVNLGITLARLVIVVFCFLLYLLLWTNHFKENYVLYIFLSVFIGLLAKFGLEAGFGKTSLLVTSLISSLTFLILSVN